MTLKFGGTIPDPDASNRSRYSRAGSHRHVPAWRSRRILHRAALRASSSIPTASCRCSFERQPAARRQPRARQHHGAAGLRPRRTRRRSFRPVQVEGDYSRHWRRSARRPLEQHASTGDDRDVDGRGRFDDDRLPKPLPSANAFARRRTIGQVKRPSFNFLARARAAELVSAAASDARSGRSSRPARRRRPPTGRRCRPRTTAGARTGRSNGTWDSASTGASMKSSRVRRRSSPTSCGPAARARVSLSSAPVFS